MSSITIYITLYLSLVLFTADVSAEIIPSKIETDFVVSKDGEGDFKKIQDAIDAAKSFPPERITIFIEPGVYKEKVHVPAWNTRISLIGEDAETTIIRWDDHFKIIDRGRNSTFFTYTLLVQGNDFYAKNLTIENSAGEVGQAVALHTEADQVMIENCRLIGNQDTIYLAGENDRVFVRDSYIEGTTDFIFGEATAWIETTEIHSKKDSYITAASTHQNSDF